MNVVNIEHPARTVTRKPKMKFGVILGGLFLVLFIATAMTAVYFFWKYKSVSSSQAVQQKELNTAISKVGALMDLPKDESPTLATITDKEKLKSQPFFERAENGDQVLFYLKLGRAILYRPSTNRIVDVTLIKATPQNSNGDTLENIVDSSSEAVTK